MRVVASRPSAGEVICIEQRRSDNSGYSVHLQELQGSDDDQYEMMTSSRGMRMIRKRPTEEGRQA